MADSLAAAEQLDLSKTDIKSYCDTSQPDHAHASSVDAVVYFKTSKEYESLAKQLRPMLTDLKVWVCGGCVVGGRVGMAPCEPRVWC